MYRKVVDLDHSSTLQPMIPDRACWYWNERYLYEEFEYVFIILIDRGNPWVFCTGKVQDDTCCHGNLHQTDKYT